MNFFFFFCSYCPSVFILQPRDYLHINKGRIHAFRKLGNTKLPDSDCHAQQRNLHFDQKGIGAERMCISLAWDWIYRGVSPGGINREVCTVLEGSLLNKKHTVKALAISELCLLQMGNFIPETTKEPELTAICTGILAGLRFVVSSHVAELAEAQETAKKCKYVTLLPSPDTRDDPASSPVDPYGNADYICKICGRELSNLYYHCQGCEHLLNRDLNLCHECFMEKKHLEFIQMHSSSAQKCIMVNHLGKLSLLYSRTHT
jgi:hypothetical protein